MRDYLLEHGGRVHKDIDDDNKIDIGFLLAGIQFVFFILYGVFVEYGEGASGEDPFAIEMQKYPQFTDGEACLSHTYPLVRSSLYAKQHLSFPQTKSMS